MPIVASMGENSGMQAVTVTVTVRALATRELDTINMLHAIGKEIAVAAVNGIIFAIVLGSMAALWFHEINLGLVLRGAMIFNILLMTQLLLNK